MPLLSTSGFFPSCPGSALGSWYQRKVGSGLVCLQRLFRTALLSSVVCRWGAWGASGGNRSDLGTTVPGASAENGSAVQLVQGSCREQAPSAVQHHGARKWEIEMRSSVPTPQNSPETRGGVGGQLKEGSRYCSSRSSSMCCQDPVPPSPPLVL